MLTIVISFAFDLNLNNILNPNVLPIVLEEIYKRRHSQQHRLERKLSQATNFQIQRAEHEDTGSDAKACRRLLSRSDHPVRTLSKIIQMIHL